MLCNRWCKILICFAVFSVPLTILSALYAGCTYKTPLYQDCPDHRTSTACDNYGKGIACKDRKYDQSNQNDWGIQGSGEAETKVFSVKAPKVCWKNGDCMPDPLNPQNCVENEDTNVDHTSHIYQEVGC